MKFTYLYSQARLISEGHELPETHIFRLEGGGLEIQATSHGVRICGSSQFFQPVDEEMHIPEEFREFMVRLSSAFDMAWKEQQKLKKNQIGRSALLSIEPGPPNVGK